MPESIQDDQTKDTWNINSVGAGFVSIVDSSGNAIKIVRSRENLAGSAGSGGDGGQDRVFTLTTSNAVDIVEVFLDGVLLVETTQYTIDNSAKTVTMVSTEVFNSQIVTIFYNV